MGTVPAPHEGIGVEHYAWCTSPLRRYVDLVNQRQLLACIREQAPPYASNDAELFGIVSGFESAYAAYAEFQQKLERYWSLRWLEQEKLTRIGATVLKSDVLRLDGVPFITRLPDFPTCRADRKLSWMSSLPTRSISRWKRACIKCWPRKLQSKQTTKSLATTAWKRRRCLRSNKVRKSAEAANEATADSSGDTTSTAS